MTRLYSQKSVVLVTGSTGPIGSAIARKFAKVLSDGSHILLTSRSNERLANLKASLLEINSKITVSELQWDLNKPDTGKFKSDLKNMSEDVKFANAVIVHNATEHGDFNHTVLEVGAHLSQLQDALNINVLSALAINTVFFELFDEANHKTIVNLTAGSADKAFASYGYNSICKAAKKMALNILAKERDDIKVLHFNPAHVDTPAFHQILKQSFNDEIKAMFQKIIDDNDMYSADHVAGVLVNYVGLNEFQTGDFVVATREELPKFVSKIQ